MCPSPCVTFDPCHARPNRSPFSQQEGLSVCQLTVWPTQEVGCVLVVVNVQRAPSGVGCVVAIGHESHSVSGIVWG